MTALFPSQPDRLVQLPNASLRANRGSSFELLLRLVAGAPYNFGHAVFMALAESYWLRRSKPVRALESNLQKILSEKGYDDRRLRSICRANIRSYFRYLHESALLPTLTASDVPQPRQVQGLQSVDKAVKAGRGVIITLPHMANMEYAGAYLASIFGPISTVATRFGTQAYYESYVQACKRLGIEIYSRDRSSPDTSIDIFVTLSEKLRAGGIVCLLCDHVASTSRAPATMFGGTALLSRGPAALAVHTGASLFPGGLWYEDSTWSGQIYDEIRVPDSGPRRSKIANIVGEMARVIEEPLVSHVTDWHMLRPFFTEDM